MGVWKLETAKARLSGVVRQVRDDGPQSITVRGAPAAVVLSADHYARLAGKVGGAHWVDRFREGFIGDLDFERDVDGGRDFEL